MRAVFVTLALLWAVAASAQPTIRDHEKGDSVASVTNISLTGTVVGDSILVGVAGIDQSSRTYAVTSDCAGDVSAWTAGQLVKEQGTTSANHAMAFRILSTTCSGTQVVTVTESATHYGYSWAALAGDCQPTCTDDDSDVFDNTGAADGTNTHSAASGQIDITAQAFAMAICSTTGTVSVTIPSGFSDYAGSFGTKNMAAYLLTTGAVADQRGTFGEANQRAAACLIYAIADGVSGGGGGGSAAKDMLLLR